MNATSLLSRPRKLGEAPSTQILENTIGDLIYVKRPGILKTNTRNRGRVWHNASFHPEAFKINYNVYAMKQLFMSLPLQVCQYLSSL